MPLFSSASGFQINGGSFIDIAGDMNVHNTWAPIEQDSDPPNALRYLSNQRPILQSSTGPQSDTGRHSYDGVSRLAVRAQIPSSSQAHDESWSGIAASVSSLSTPLPFPAFQSEPESDCPSPFDRGGMCTTGPDQHKYASMAHQYAAGPSDLPHGSINIPVFEYPLTNLLPMSGKLQEEKSLSSSNRPLPTSFEAVVHPFSSASTFSDHYFPFHYPISTPDVSSIASNRRSWDTLPPGPQTNINGGTFIGGNVNPILRHGEPDLQGLHILYRAAAGDASHDSEDRFPQPRCHPETRTELLDVLWDWATGIKPPKALEHERHSIDLGISVPRPFSPVLWLHGPAGAGKSAIAQSLCQKLEAQGRLGASFFFRRGHPSRGHAKRLFSTIAYQLALHRSDLDFHIFRNVENNPLTPCQQIRSSDALIVVIDGLDECEGQNIQKEILYCIGRALDEQQLPLRFLIASRPEPHIYEIFSGALHRIHHPLDIEQSFEDVRRYLLDEFGRIYREHRDTMTTISGPWPSPEIIDYLVQKSSGYFIYASTLIEFIDDRNFRPTERLEVIMGTKEADFGSPFAALDQLYIQILSQVHARPQLLRILAVFAAQIMLSASEIEQLLELQPGDVRLTLRGLHSVISGLQEDADGPIFVHHASFPDFFQDPLRAGIFHVGRGQHRTELSRKILRAFSYKYDDPSLNRQGHVARGLGVSAFQCIASVEPSFELLTQLQCFNPDFLFSAADGAQIVGTVLHWLKKSLPPREDLIQLWEDYRFMLHCAKIWSDGIEILFTRTVRDFYCQILSSAPPPLIKILQAVKCMDRKSYSLLFQIHILLDFSWDKLRTAICSLRSLIGEEEEPINNVWIVANDPTVFPVRFESMMLDLARGSLSVIRQIFNGQVDRDFELRGWSCFLMACPPSLDLLQDLWDSEPAWNNIAVFETHNVVQWLKTFQSPGPEEFGKFDTSAPPDLRIHRTLAKAKRKDRIRQQSRVDEDSVADLAARNATASDVPIAAIAAAGGTSSAAVGNDGESPSLLADHPDSRSAQATSVGVSALSPSADISSVHHSYVDGTGGRARVLPPSSRRNSLNIHDLDQTAAIGSRPDFGTHSQSGVSSRHNSRKTPPATVEEVEDEDDSPREKARRALARSQQGDPVSRPILYSGVDSRVPFEQLASNGKVRTQSAGESLHEQADSASEAVRDKARVAGKQRKHYSEHSSDTTSIRSDTEAPRNFGDPALYRLAAEALARERQSQENSVEYRRRVEALLRAEKQLREVRVAEDRAYAEALAALYASEDADAIYAQQLDDDQRAANDSVQARRSYDELKKKEEVAHSLEVAARRAREETEQLRKEVTTESVQIPIKPRDTEGRGAALDVHSQTGSRVPSVRKRSVAGDGIPLTPAGNPPSSSLDFANRTIVQRYRLQEIAKDGRSYIPDQNIDWDVNGKPYATGPAPVMPRWNTGESRPLQSPVEVINPVKMGNTSTPFTFNKGSREHKSVVRVNETRPEPGDAGRPRSLGSAGHEEEDSREPAGAAGGGGGGSSSPSDSDAYDSEGESYRTGDSQSTRSSDTDSAWGDAHFGYTEEITTNNREGSMPHTRSGATYGGGGGPPNDPGGGGGSDGETDEGDHHRGPSRTPRRNPDETERSRRRRHKRNTRRNHHSHGVRDRKSDLVEPGDPRIAGHPHKGMKKWRGSIHYHYHCLLTETLSEKMEGASILEENKHLKVPHPPTYNGVADVIKFDEHLIAMVRWLQLNGLGGKENDQRRIVTHGFYLTGAARLWYENQVGGMYRTKRRWTYREFVIGLFDRFIDTASVQRATDVWFTAKYSKEIGIMGLYYELMGAARRMIKKPDSYTFKQNFIARMPAAMIHGILMESNVTAEYSSIREVVNAATAWEWKRSLEERYKEQVKLRAHAGEFGGKGAAFGKDAPREGAREARIMAGRVMVNGKPHRIFKRPRVENDTRRRDFRPDHKRVIPRELPRPGGRDGGEARVKPMQGATHPNGQSTRVACYTCGGPHYKNECPQNKTRAPILFAGREIVEERDEKSPDSVNAPLVEEQAGRPPQEGPASEQLRHIVDDEAQYVYEIEPEDAQYDSEYTLEECSEYSSYEDDVLCFHMTEMDDLPSLEEVEDSDDEESEVEFQEQDEQSPCHLAGERDNSDNELNDELDRFDTDSCFNEETGAGKKLGLFGVCDDYSDEEFVTEEDIDELAEKMAACLMFTRDPKGVVEYFAAGYDRELDDGKSTKSKNSNRRGVYLKRSRKPRPRPARSKAENFCLTSYVKVNGREAFALFDSGCTTEACSPDFARVAGIEVFPIQSEVTLQLGTAGSRSKINHGATATVEYDDIKSDEYLDIVNLDQFDLIIGTKFMRKHRMALDFQFNTIKVAGVPARTLSVNDEMSEVERRNAARRLARETRQ
ncbi:WD40 repeat-like protein [Mycena venus]|uniref:WD40 repeat-like protein n=1 Tax=Mycena venus TaxID=2733690 RepID=A0A8H7DF82_9AGAR|nr:WD40 repeat-like protein [Mycena venus]